MTSLFRIRYEISFLIISLMIGILAFSSSRKLPAPTFEPMGSAAFPSAIATVTLVLALLKFLQLFVTLSAPREKEEEEEGSRFSRSLIMLLLFAAFVAMINFFNLPLWASSSLFLTAATIFLKKPTSIVPLTIQLLVIVIFSLLLDYTATQFLYLDL